MGFKSKTKNIIEKWLTGERGKRVFQVCYSIGAAIIIIGVLAKLMHWPNGLGNTLLYVGFITEAFIFSLSAFDRPSMEYEWDRVFPVLKTDDDDDRPDFRGGGGGSGSVVLGAAGGSINGTGSGGGGGVSGGGGGTVAERSSLAAHRSVAADLAVAAMHLPARKALRKQSHK